MLPRTPLHRGRWMSEFKRQAWSSERSLPVFISHTISRASTSLIYALDEVNPCFGQVFILKRPRTLQGGDRMGKRPRGTTAKTFGLHRLVIVSECAISKASRCHNDDPTAGACLYARIYARHDTDFGTWIQDKLHAICQTRHSPDIPFIPSIAPSLMLSLNVSTVALPSFLRVHRTRGSYCQEHQSITLMLLCPCASYLEKRTRARLIDYSFMKSI